MHTLQSTRDPLQCTGTAKLFELLSQYLLTRTVIASASALTADLRGPLVGLEEVRELLVRHDADVAVQQHREEGTKTPLYALYRVSNALVCTV